MIHQANAVGRARNAALYAAKGVLIAFVDSDDYIAPDMFAHLHELLMQGTDIVEYGYADIFDDNAIFSNDTLYVYGRESHGSTHSRPDLQPVDLE